MKTTLLFMLTTVHPGRLTAYNASLTRTYYSQRSIHDDSRSQLPHTRRHKAARNRLASTHASQRLTAPDLQCTGLTAIDSSHNTRSTRLHDDLCLTMHILRAPTHPGSLATTCHESSVMPSTLLTPNLVHLCRYSRWICCIRLNVAVLQSAKLSAI
jgi:hypothetical protein